MVSMRVWALQQQARGAAARLVEVGGGELPGFRGKVDVVRVVHLAQVVEAAPLPGCRCWLSVSCSSMMHGKEQQQYHMHTRALAPRGGAS